ncbi:MAG: hypothetical protein WD604_08130 [Balneolaceae bacterium]
MIKNNLFSISNSNGQSIVEEPEPQFNNPSLSINFDQLEKEGTKAAGKSQGDFIVFKMWVNRILTAHVQKVTQNSNKAKNRIKKLEQEIEELKASIRVRSDEKEEIEKFKVPEIQEEIKKKKLRIEEIKAGNVEGEPVDRLGYYLSIGILAALTIYLVIFYTSVIYGAFIFSAEEAVTQGVAAGESYVFPTIVNLDAVPSVYENHGLLGAVFLIVSTSMFIALGYLIHKFQEGKEYIKATGILTFTFIFDVILAYGIVEVIHEAKYLSGLVDSPWEYSMVLTEVPFYIIIFAGFAVYIIWGLVLDYVFEEREKMRPGVGAIRKLKGEIEILANELKEFKAKKSEHREEINLLESKIKTKEMDKEKDIFDKKEVGHLIGNFVSGWVGFLRMSYDEPVSSQKIELVKNHVEVFMTKIEEKDIQLESKI